MIIVTAVLAWLLSAFGWWMIAVVTFLAALLAKMKPGRGFVFGFISMALLWHCLILVRDIANDHILSARMAAVIGVPYFVLLIINVLIGALMGGLGGWSGAAMRGIFKKKG